jgi:hypothetical protein
LSKISSSQYLITVAWHHGISWTILEQLQFFFDYRSLLLPRMPYIHSNLTHKPQPSCSNLLSYAAMLQDPQVASLLNSSAIIPFLRTYFLGFVGGGGLDGLG